MPNDVDAEVENLDSESGSMLDALNEGLDKADKAAAEKKGSDVDTDDIEDITDDTSDEVKDEDEDEVEEEDEEEEEEEDELDEEEELKDAETPDLIRSIEKKYPKIFKEFKPLRQAVIRDAAYGRIFTNPQEAADQAQVFEGYKEFESALLQGENERVLSAIKSTSSDGYKKFVGQFLPSLRNLDQNSYYEVTAPVLAEMLSSVQETGKARGDRNLYLASRHIASLIWPSLKGEIPDFASQKPNPETDARARQLEEKERSIMRREIARFGEDLKSTTSRLLRKRVEKELDPGNVLSPYLKNSVVDNTIKEIKELLDEDRRFGKVMDDLFQRAIQSNFSTEFRTRMIGTYVSKVSQLIGPIRKRHLQAALGKSTGKETPPPKRRDVGDATSQGRSQAVRKENIDWSKSDLDIMSGRGLKKK
jgi:hypothetical protein